MCPDNPTVLIIKLSSLGDLFHALPVAHACKEKIGATITWITQTEYADLVARFKPVDHVLTFARHHFWHALPQLLKNLRTQSFDYVLDLQGLLKSASVAAIVRSPNKIGPSYYREGATLFYTAIAGKRNKERHAVDEAWDFVRYFGWEGLTPQFPLRILPPPLVLGRPAIGLVPCSRWPTKNWPHFPALAKSLYRDTGASIYLLGGPDDIEACNKIQEQSAGVPMTNLCGKTSLPELLDLLAAMDLVITVDSGPMHMAAAVNTPLLAIFGATDPVRTGPYSQQAQVIYGTGIDCRPCLERQCQRNDLACLQSIRAEEVSDRAIGMIKAKSGLL